MSIRLILISLFFLLAISLPFIFAASVGGAQAVFSGFLLNPQDGATYLAKMYQGWQGAWRYHLPFTADPGAEVFLFVFYLFLGHLARWTGLSLVLTFHIARLVGAICLLAALWRFLKVTVPTAWRVWTFALALFGLGLGWLALPLGRLTSDFWVAETYVFLSAYANPHFVFSLALLLALLTLPPVAPRRSGLVFVAAALVGLALSLLSPFALVIAAAALAGALALEWFLPPAGAASRGALLTRLRGFLAAPRPRQMLPRLAGALIGGAPFSVYNVALTRIHPQLAVWNAQNLTWTPAAWDVLLALSPALLLALYAARRVVRDRAVVLYPLLAWAGSALALIYLPVDLQRRFMVGLSLPLVALAGYGLAGLAADRPVLARRLGVVGLGLALPTTLLMLGAGLVAVRTLDPALYFSVDEARSLAWLEANSASNALVLASPQMGLWIPAQTGRRVIYGHCFETPAAEAEQAAVEDFFAGRLPDSSAFLRTRGVDFVLYGERERTIGPLPAGLSLEPVFSSGAVTLYRVVLAP